MAEWRDGGMAEWRDGGMAEGRNGGMVFYYIPNLSCYIYGTCRQCQRRQRCWRHGRLLNHLDVLTEGRTLQPTKTFFVCFFVFTVCRFCTSKQSFGYFCLGLARWVFGKVFVRDWHKTKILLESFVGPRSLKIFEVLVNPKVIYKNFHFIALTAILLGLSILQISITILQRISWGHYTSNTCPSLSSNYSENELSFPPCRGNRPISSCLFARPTLHAFISQLLLLCICQFG